MDITALTTEEVTLSKLLGSGQEFPELGALRTLYKPTREEIAVLVAFIPLPDETFKAIPVGILITAALLPHLGHPGEEVHGHPVVNQFTDVRLDLVGRESFWDGHKATVIYYEPPTEATTKPVLVVLTDEMFADLADPVTLA